MKRIFNTLFLALVLTVTATFAQSDAELRSAQERDKTARDGAGRLTQLSATEHAARGEVYFENRHFPEAREHFTRILEGYPGDPGIARALFVIGRSYMWERQYEKAIVYLDRVAREFPGSKDG